MARLTGIFTKLSGSVGQFTFKQLNGDTVVSEKVARKANPIRTWNQMRRRVAWDNIVAIYKAFTGHLHPSFEGKDRRLNDANMFMKSNINVVKVFLTKEEAAQGACVVAPYQITRGSMPSIEVSDNDGIFCTDINLGEGATITSGTTVKAFSDMVVNNNAEFVYGDEIACFVATQKTNAVTGMPYVLISATSVTLDASDTRRLYDVVNKKGFAASDDSFLCAEEPVNGGIAWVHSRRSESGTMVSTQRFEVSNATLANYQTPEQMSRAIYSYGDVRKDEFLTPDRDADAEIQSGI